MAYQFERHQKPTGGKPPPVVVEYQDMPGWYGKRVAFNLSPWWLPVQRADGSQDVVHRQTTIVLEPGDKVLEPQCAYDPVDAQALMLVKLEGFRAYQQDQWSRMAEAFELKPEPPEYNPGRWWWARRLVRPGVALHLQPGSFGNAKLSLSMSLEAIGSEQQWCFHDNDAAWRAVVAWNGQGDPEGFYRCYQTGRRREDGTPESEHILW